MANSRLRVALTRQSKDNADLARALTNLGFEVLDWPAVAIRFQKPQRSNWRKDLSMSKAVAFVSPNAAHAFFSVCDDAGQVLSRVISQGPGTSQALVSNGCAVHAEAFPSTSSGLAQALIAVTEVGDEIAVICGDKSRSELLERLTSAGRKMTRYVCYVNEAPVGIQRDPQPLDLVVFCSPSAARRSLEANPWLKEIAAVAIGPLTASFLRDTAQLSSVTMSRQPSVDSMLKAIVGIAEKESR